MPDLMEDILTCADDRIFVTTDDAVVITGDVAAIPTGFAELEENSSIEAEARGTTQDGQTRKDRGHAHPVVTNREDTLTFALKPQVGVDPVQDHEIDVGTIMRILVVKSDGYYISYLVQVTRVRETSTLGGLPAWEGTAEVRAHPTRGRVTTWPPGGVITP
jgi:hypothetical protein